MELELDLEGNEINVGFVEAPHLPFVKDKHSRYMDSRKDVLINISIEDLFILICETEDNFAETLTNVDYYTLERTNVMKLFGYISVPEILQNIDNLNVNLTMYNTFLLEKKKEDRLITSFTQQEIYCIVKCSITLIQDFIATHTEVV